MVKINSILDQRMSKQSNGAKMAAMAKQTAAGNLTSFSGVFHIVELQDKEKEVIENIVKNYAAEETLTSAAHDLSRLLSLTSEVKAINNQAALLHGERIKQAHKILIHYREGAFTAWLMAAYGNRQTPYNFLQYYEFCEAMPKELRPQIEIIPRQAIYVLASRSGDLEKKQKIVENYEGETKKELLELIREQFPLQETDRRQVSQTSTFLQELRRVSCKCKGSPPLFSSREQEEVLALVATIENWVKFSL